MNARLMRTVLVVVATVPLVVAVGCGSSSERKSNATPTGAAGITTGSPSVDTIATEGNGATVTNRKWKTVWNAHADGFGGNPVVLEGLVQRDTGKSLIVYGNPSGRKQPAEVSGHYPGIRKRDYVLVKGTISGSRTRNRVARDSVHVVTIDGFSVNPIGRDHASALAHPVARNQHKLGLSQTRGGFRVTLRSLDWTGSATRLEVTVTNHGSAKAGISASHPVIQQGLRQNHLSEGDKGAHALTDEIRPGATKRATMTFDRISRKRGKAYIEFGWYSVSRGLDTHQPFAFTMRWKP